jgi:flagellar hook-associated protein 3 FlgL
MTPSINPNAEIFLSNLQQIQNRMSTAEQQLSSGLRVSVASDDPDEISSILQLRAQIAGVQQTQENLANVTPQVESGENAIQQAIQVLDTATSLATETSGSTSSASQRLDAVPQVQGILQQLVSLSQTAANGQYIFSGDQGAQPQYTLAANGTVPAELSGRQSRTDRGSQRGDDLDRIDRPADLRRPGGGRCGDRQSRAR